MCQCKHITDFPKDQLESLKQIITNVETIKVVFQNKLFLSDQIK